MDLGFHLASGAQGLWPTCTPYLADLRASSIALVLDLLSTSLGTCFILVSSVCQLSAEGSCLAGARSLGEADQIDSAL